VDVWVDVNLDNGFVSRSGGPMVEDEFECSRYVCRVGRLNSSKNRYVLRAVKGAMGEWRI